MVLLHPGSAVHKVSETANCWGILSVTGLLHKPTARMVENLFDDLVYRDIQHSDTTNI